MEPRPVVSLRVLPWGLGESGAEVRANEEGAERASNIERENLALRANLRDVRVEDRKSKRYHDGRSAVLERTGRMSALVSGEWTARVNWFTTRSPTISVLRAKSTTRYSTTVDWHCHCHMTVLSPLDRRSVKEQLWRRQKRKKKLCICRDSNPNQLLGRQL